MRILPFLFGRNEVKAIVARVPQYPGDDRPAHIAAAGTHTSTEALGELCSHYDGHVRQAALMRCVQLARGDLLPLVASRLNDWVAPIRRAARQGMETLVPLVPPAAVIDVLPAVAQLRFAKREDHGQWIDCFERAVSLHVPVEELVEAMQRGPVATSRACFMLLRNHGLIAPQTLVAMALETRADIVILRMALSMCAGLDASVRTGMYEKALRSQFGAIRTLAIRALLMDDATPDKLAVATGALLDSQPTVRDAAAYHLKQAGASPATVYRKTISEAADRDITALALASLGTCGDRDDIEFILPYTKSATAVVRGAALLAWLRLAPSAKDDIALQAMEDPSSRLRRFAMLVVHRHKAYVARERVLAVIVRTGDFRLLDLMPTGQWNYLETMVRLHMHFGASYTFPDRVLAPLADCLQGRQWTAPTAQQLAFFRSTAARPTVDLLVARYGAGDGGMVALLDGV